MMKYLEVVYEYQPTNYRWDYRAEWKREYVYDSVREYERALDDDDLLEWEKVDPMNEPLVCNADHVYKLWRKGQRGKPCWYYWYVGLLEIDEDDLEIDEGGIPR